jgi:hypothetical protein
VDYPLENLGPERFQHFCQALLAREYRGIQCFPVAQPDGGRDAIMYPTFGDTDKFMVFQVKFSRRPQAETDPHKWLAAIVDAELPKVKTLIARGATEYVLMTNVPGTAHLATGSIDTLNRKITETLGLPSMCWWRDDINRKLDDAWALKWVYPELMTGPDFLRAIVESGLSEHRERRAATIRSFLRAQYGMDEEVRFKQVELQNKLVDLFIDVPIAPRDEHLEPRQAHFFHALSRSVLMETEEDDMPIDDHVMAMDSPGNGAIGAATLLLSPTLQYAMPRLVVEGAPGQGKSTIAQYVCQVHRMRLLQEDDTLSCIAAEHRQASVRLPVKVDLRDLATWMDKRDPFNVDDQGARPTAWHKSLESFLAALISNQSGGTQFSSDDLLAVLRISAVLLVFDGLDEVADIARRSEVVEEIVKGVQRLEENAASLQVVVTSRPAAFANSPGMPHGKYPHLQLLSLTKPNIMLYAERWLRARRLDSKQSAEFRAVLKSKLDQPHLRDLARNPMQLAILLSLVLTRGASLPDKRTALYDYYIDLFFSREAEKSAVVRNHRDLLIDVHRYLAWLLHSEAELGHARASITQDRLQRVVSEYLYKEGHDPTLAKDLFTGMVERVVALVSRVEGTFEFEVQPLREYFAACHLYYTAPQSSPGKERPGPKPDRFDAIARNFFWLNVTRFYAGCYSKGELSSLIERLQELADEKGFHETSYPRMLAAILLADWVFTQNPKSVQQAVDLVLDGSGLRYLIAQLGTTKRTLEAANISALPPKCGREELIRICLDRLQENLPRDYGDEVLNFVRLNDETGAELTNPWIERYRQQTRAEDRTRWLRYGLTLGVLQKVELQQLKQLIGTNTLHLSSLDVLFRARRLDYLHGSEVLFDQVVEAILNGQIVANALTRPIESPLDALSGAISPWQYQIVFRERHPLPLAKLLERHGVSTKLSWNADVATNTESYKNHQPCVQFARIVEGVLQRSGMEWATEIGPWETLIESGREIWGDRWAFFYLANLAGGIRSTSDKCSDSPDLLDVSRPLSRRARYARLRSGANVWWKTQIELATSQDDQLFALLISLTWGTSNTLIAILDQLDEALGKLSRSQWLRLFYAVRRVSMLARGGEGGRESLDMQIFPQSLSTRAAAIFMTRGDEKTCHAIFQKYIESSREDNPVILEFVLHEALDLKQFGTQDWSPDLETIRRCYKLGEVEMPGSLYRNYRREALTAIPLHLAETVVRSPNDYPGFLVAVAEDRCRQQLATQIVPVAQVAEREHWFTAP